MVLISLVFNIVSFLLYRLTLFSRSFTRLLRGFISLTFILIFVLKIITINNGSLNSCRRVLIF